MTALSVVGAQWRLPAADRAVLMRDFLPWAVRSGSRSTDLMCLYYEQHLEVHLSCFILMKLEIRAKSLDIFQVSQISCVFGVPLDLRASMNVIYAILLRTCCM